MRYQSIWPYPQLHLELHHPYKRQTKLKEEVKRSTPFSLQIMSQLMPPFAPSRQRSQRFIQRDIDEFLSSDLEVSFASTISLNSPPNVHVPLTPGCDYAEPMDISPAPPPKPLFVNAANYKPTSRPRAHTTNSRLFGGNISNSDIQLPNSQAVLPLSIIKSAASNNATRSINQGIQRSALPTEWLVSARAPEIKLEVWGSELPPPKTTNERHLANLATPSLRR